MKKATRVITKTFAKENRDMVIIKLELTLLAAVALWPLVKATH